MVLLLLLLHLLLLLMLQCVLLLLLLVLTSRAQMAAAGVGHGTDCGHVSLPGHACCTADGCLCRLNGCLCLAQLLLAPCSAAAFDSCSFYYQVDLPLPVDRPRTAPYSQFNDWSRDWYEG